MTDIKKEWLTVKQCTTCATVKPCKYLTPEHRRRLVFGYTCILYVKK